MSLTILFDLDDTLFFNDMDAFLPVYLKGLAKQLSRRFEGDRLIRCLLDATREMVKNTRPDRTLEQVFAAHFYPALGVSAEEIRPEIDRFYAEIYPSLEPLTKARPEAVGVVEEVLRRGHRLAIATNPLFPRTAVYQRLAWAGLPIADFPFEIVTAYETFHFTKPHRAYYSEVLAQMGWPEGPAVMIGNDSINDIQPASRAGLYTFLLTDQAPGFDQTPHATGGFEDLLAWLEWIEAAQPPLENNPRDALLPVLRSTPAAINTLTCDLNREQWTTIPSSGEWSITEVLCHLRDVAAEVDEPRMEKVIQEENPFIAGMDTDPWAAERDYAAQDGPSALNAFTSTRMRLLEMLERLPAKAWGKPARHAIFGPTHLDELVGFIATHDRAHVQQTYQTICSEAVQILAVS
jgi:FMN phosphatase YigB (HAD superfamily)